MKSVFIPLVRNELLSKLPVWELLEKVKNGGVKHHLLTVLYLVMLDPILIGMSPEHKKYTLLVYAISLFLGGLHTVW